jgi:hypothetical protein
VISQCHCRVETSFVGCKLSLISMLQFLGDKTVVPRCYYSSFFRYGNQDSITNSDASIIDRSDFENSLSTMRMNWFANVGNAVLVVDAWMMMIFPSI